MQFNQITLELGHGWVIHLTEIMVMITYPCHNFKTAIHRQFECITLLGAAHLFNPFIWIYAGLIPVMALICLWCCSMCPRCWRGVRPRHFRFCGTYQLPVDGGLPDLCGGGPRCRQCRHVRPRRQGGAGVLQHQHLLAVQLERLHEQGRPHECHHPALPRREHKHCWRH